MLLDTNELVMSSVEVKTIKNRYLKYINEVNSLKGSIMLEPFLEIGFENYILPYRVNSILNSISIPNKKIIKNAKSTNTLIDCTQGRKTRSVITLKNGNIIISIKDPKTIEKTYMNYINNIYNINTNMLNDSEELKEELEENFEKEESLL